MFLAIRGFRPQLRISGEDLSKISAPTLVIWGHKTPSEHPRLPGKPPAANARVEMLDAGHLPWLGRPNQVGELIGTFLAEQR